MNKNFIIVDGTSFIFRAFYGMPNFTSPQKKPTGATYGIANMLKQMLKKYSTYHWCCVFDAPGKTFRHELYKDYKANRIDTPIDLIPQFEDIYKIIPSLGIKIIIEPNVEADDVIGALALHAKKDGYSVLIASGDKDFAQLVDDKITLINTMTDEVLDVDGVINKFNVSPSQIIDYLTLIGDKIDNVPGVNKCGPKTAVKWLNEYKTLDNIIANHTKITGVVGKNLESAIPNLPLSKTLITLKTDINLTHVMSSMDEFILKNTDDETLKNMYNELGFKTWFNQLNLSPKDESQEGVKTYHTTNKTNTNTIDNNVATINKSLVIINNHDEYNNILKNLIKANQTLGVYILRDTQINQIHKFYATDNANIYIINNQINTVDLFDDGKLSGISWVDGILNTPNPKIFINYKDTLSICTKHDISINNTIGDINLSHYVLNSRLSHNITNIYTEYLNFDITQAHLTNSSHLDNNEISIIDYNLLNHIHKVLSQIETKMDGDDTFIYRNIELPLVPVLVNIEHNGIMIDIGKFKIMNNNVSCKLKELEDQIYHASNQVFNINSTKQLQDVLFNKLHLPTFGIKKNTHGYSTDEDALRHLSKQGFTIADLLLEYRGLSKLLNTYIKKLPPLVDNKSRLHTTFEQALVISGRLSSKEPNLQNIPVKNKLGRLMRSCFIASVHTQLICVDYSQIELRILAHFSTDENLLNAFNTNQDVHSITACEIFNKPINDITPDERRYAKTINFSLIYGKTVFGLAQELNIDRVTAKLYIDKYFAKYPKVLECLENFKNLARQNGYVSTLYGRKIYLPSITHPNKMIREAEERVSLNAPMQGTSADIIKISMNKIANWLNKNHLKTKMILQVHDELIFEVPDNEIEIIQSNLSNLMTSGFEDKLLVKLAVDLKIANNWDEAH